MFSHAGSYGYFAERCHLIVVVALLLSSKALMLTYNASCYHGPSCQHKAKSKVIASTLQPLDRQLTLVFFSRVARAPALVDTTYFVSSQNTALCTCIRSRGTPHSFLRPVDK